MYYKNLIKEAHNLHVNGNYVEAKKLYTDIIKNDPHNFDALHLIALIYLEEKDLLNSKYYFLKAFNLNNYDFNINYNYALLLMEMNDFETAILYLENSVNYGNKNDDIILNLGIIYFNINKIYKSILYFNKYIKLKPTYLGFYNRGIALKKYKKYNLAINDFEIAINLNNFDPNLFYNKAICYIELLDFNNAIIELNKALAIKADNFLYYDALAICFHNLNNLNEALININYALNLKSDYNLLYFHRANIHLENKSYENAILDYNYSIKLDNRHSDSYSNLSIIYKNCNELEQALFHINKAIYLNKNEKYLTNRATIYEMKNLFNSAIADLNEAISININFKEAHYNLGCIYYKINNFLKAISCFNNTLQLDKFYFNALLNLGLAYKHLNNYSLALKAFFKAIEINPSDYVSYLNIGTVYFAINDFKNANLYYIKALQLCNNSSELFLNIGSLLLEEKKYKEAIQNYCISLSLSTNQHFLLGILLFTKSLICDWNDFNILLQQLKDRILLNLNNYHPFPLLSLFDDPQVQYVNSKKFSNSSNLVKNKFTNNYYNNKIRVGYFSPDFKDHAVSYLTAEIFELHNKDYFEIYAFSLINHSTSSLRNRLISAFDDFLEVEHLDNFAIKNLCFDLKIDIAVDLAGYTKNARENLFSQQLAPVQIGYIGFLGTMGTVNYDYIIADKFLIDTDNRKYFEEKIIYLPSYYINDSKRVHHFNNFSNFEKAFPKNYFIFCSFNNTYKINYYIFQSWVEILKRNTNSILILYIDNNSAKDNLVNFLVENDICIDRVVFCNRVSRDVYMSQYKDCHLSLDTYPYNGGTTSIDALFADVPVLTLKGNTMASRVGSSLLHSLNLTELICNTVEDYINLAVKISTDQFLYNSIKSKLINNKFNSLLFNSSSFVKSLESAYYIVNNSAINDYPPSDFSSL